jgi:hypothetical protein
MAKPGAPRYKDMPLNIVGSNKFSRYPKMSSEETFNMIISDGWLVPFGGYRLKDFINPGGQGRGVYSSAKLRRLFCVIDNNIWSYDLSFSRSFIGIMTTFVGDVFIAENNAGQVVFSDNQSLYVFSSQTNTFDVLTTTDLGFRPGYITFQDGRLISPALDTNFWRLSEVNNALSWPNDAQHVGSVATKAGNAIACVRFPGKGNLLLVFGQLVGEQWTDLGLALFPYQKSQSTNIDYGCANPATIAENEKIVCWVSVNEKSGPAIMYTNGVEVERISTDGIDFKLAALTQPSNCYGFMVRLDGHLCYIVSWPADNISYLYDFNTNAFFTLCDESMNVFIATRIAFFNNQYYFVSLRDGNLYQLSGSFSTYDYGDGNIHEIPFIRIPANIALPDQSGFNAGYAGFTIESGQFPYDQPATNNVPRIDCCLSKDGGVTYGSNVQRIMRPQGIGKNRLMWRNFGYSNDLTFQFRFHGYGRFIASDGIVGIYQ